MQNQDYPALRLTCLYILLILCFISCKTVAQNAREHLSPKEKKIFEEAKKYAQQGNFKKSNETFEKLLSIKNDFTEGYLRLASNHFQEKSYQKSEELFSKAIQIAPDFDVEMYYSLAMSQMEQNKYLQAADNLDVYISNVNAKPEKVKRAMKFRDNLRFTDFAIKNPVPFIPKSVGDNINSTNSEYSPFISLDGNKMIFTRNVKKPSDFIGQEDFYISDASGDGKWGLAYPFSDLNTSQNEGAFSIAANGKYIVFTACDRKDSYGSCDLYYSMLLDSQWTNPVNMGHKVNSAAWDSQPTLSADARTLLFTSKRLGTIGGSDIFMTYRDPKNAWITPINLGPIINTEGDDESPFLHPDGSTLYFRSNGRPGMGKYDIYFSRKNDTTDLWQTPINIGYPINTNGDEGSLTVSLDGKHAYYASDFNFATGQKMNHLDIFSFELYEAARPKPTTFIKGFVTDAETSKPVKATVGVKDLKSGKVVFQIQTDDDGFFISSITAGKNYAWTVENKSYAYFTENFDLSKKNLLIEPFILNIKLNPIKKASETIISKPTILKNIFFDTGSAELLPESDHEITLLYKMMIENPGINIRLTGHTDNIGSEQDNLLLSQNRAKAVAEAIVKKGIFRDRIMHEGKGKSMPIADNLTEEGRRLNRRTEMLILH